MLEKFKNMVRKKSHIYLQIYLKNFLFSSSAQVIVSYLFTVAKYYIYKSKFNTK